MNVCCAAKPESHRSGEVAFPEDFRYIRARETQLNRRRFLATALLAPVAAPAFQAEKSKLKITGVRIVKTKERKAPPAYTPAPGSWSTGGVEVANPMSIYPRYKAQRSLFQPDDPEMGGFPVEISTDKGVKGYGRGGPAGGAIVEKH